MKLAIAAFLLLCAVWLLWSGHLEPLPVGLGFGSCVLVVVLARRLRVIDAESYPFQLMLGLLTYIPWVFWQVLLANLSVARVILSPSLPISPCLARVKATQRTEIGRVIHANTITITPGTISLDLRGDVILVHSLTRHACADDVQGVIDQRVNRLEGRPG